MFAPFVKELDSAPLSHFTGKRRSNSYGSSSSCDDSIPEMISYSSDLDDSISSSSRSLSRDLQSPISPRSIFQNYWSSPTHQQSSTQKENEEDEVLARLQTLQMPLVSVEDEIGDGDCAAVKIVQAPLTRTRAASIDDASVDYKAASSTSSPTRTPRRQILPTPPPPTALSSSLIEPRRQQPRLTSYYYGRRTWSSTTALLVKDSHPSILRKSRYSCSAIITGECNSKLNHSLRNNGSNNLRHSSASIIVPSGDTGQDLGGDLKKSVSFYSEVSVREFEVPQEQRKSQKGWSKYFA